MDFPLALEPETESLLTKVYDGKDEMNLAEFPLCSISDRLQSNQNTLTFEDRVWDRDRGEMVTRRLTITASAEHGLPTAHDDEVLLGLIQLSKLQDFSERRVQFTRYQLLRLIDWSDDSKSYERVEKSLNRWVGVTLYYKNAWWSKEKRCWADEKFHIIDNVRLFGRDAVRGSPAQGTQPLSSFTWNDTIFRSFRAGNLKSLDFELFNALKSSVAKRLYRFLDKRFFHKARQEFDLKEFAWEHIGLARSYDTANLKRKLKPSIEELEERGFLLAMRDEERFLKLSSGQWKIVFEKADSKAERVTNTVATNDEREPLKKALIERGVSPFAATEVVARYPIERIRTQLEAFDWLVDHADKRVSKNPAGFLISSIKAEYAPPKGFLTREEQEKNQKHATERKLRAEEKIKRVEQQAQERARAQEFAIQQFWASLSTDERSRLQAEAMQNSPTLQRQLAEKPGSLGDAARKAVLDAHALKIMQVEV